MGLKKKYFRLRVSSQARFFFDDAVELCDLLCLFMLAISQRLRTFQLNFPLLRQGLPSYSFSFTFFFVFFGVL